MDRSGTLWVGTDTGGLNQFDPATGAFTRYQHDPNDPRSLSHNRVNSIYEDPPGTLWLGTYGGLNRFDPATEQFTYFTEQDGLRSNTIYGVIGDEEGMLWISTSGGLSRFDPDAETFTNYDVASGLPNIQFTSGTLARNTTGDLFFGGINGFTAFRPSNLPDASYKPPLVITSFKKQDEVVATDLDEGQPLELSYKDGLFSFDFALLDYAAPPPIGINTSWRASRKPGTTPTAPRDAPRTSTWQNERATSGLSFADLEDRETGAKRRSCSRLRRPGGAQPGSGPPCWRASSC